MHQMGLLCVKMECTTHHYNSKKLSDKRAIVIGTSDPLLFKSLAASPPCSLRGASSHPRWGSNLRTCKRKLNSCNDDYHVYVE